MKFYKTNVYGEANNNDLPTGIDDMAIEEKDKGEIHIYDLNGRMVRRSTTSLEGLSHGIYIVGGKKVVK